MMPLKFGARFTLTAQLSLDQPHLKCSTATRSPESQNKSPRQSEQTGFSLSMHKVWGMQLKQMNYQDLKIRIFHLKKKKKKTTTVWQFSGFSWQSLNLATTFCLASLSGAESQLPLWGVVGWGGCWNIPSTSISLPSISHVAHFANFPHLPGP